MQELFKNPYHYIFVGGKGGVGKTTTSSSISIQLAKQLTPKKVLLISTDPAHNVSDAFGQQFSSTIQQVNGIDNLFAVEIDPKDKIQDMQENQQEKHENQQNANPIFGKLQGMIQNFSHFPGLDEIMNFLEIMKLAMSNEYETVVFDTAPTGHTMRFLEIPRLATKMFQMFDELKDTFGPLMGTMGQMFGIDQQQAGTMGDDLKKNLEICTLVQQKFEDPTQTTFICVCIPEFLSLYETERLVQHLARINIDCQTIVVNQVINVMKDCKCQLCKARSKMQQKYLKQIQDLYDDFIVVKMPMLENEVRGLEDLSKFGVTLLNGFKFE